MKELRVKLRKSDGTTSYVGRYSGPLNGQVIRAQSFHIPDPLEDWDPLAPVGMPSTYHIDIAVKSTIKSRTVDKFAFDNMRREGFDALQYYDIWKDAEMAVDMAGHRYTFTWKELEVDEQGYDCLFDMNEFDPDDEETDRSERYFDNYRL